MTNDDQQFWHDFLTRGDSRELLQRRILRRLPHGPRCRMCAAPFAGPAAPVMRLMGKPPSGSNPTMCQSCFTFISENHGGAEIEASFLFADVRGSTTLAEAATPAAFRDVMNRFYSVATKVVFDHDGSVDKFVGDEVVALFFPLLSGERHAAKAVEAAQALLRATGHGQRNGPWLPVGAGVHTGISWFGAVGEGARTDLTALGDAVNTTARLASLAGAGEILVSGDAATAAGLDPSLDRRLVDLKGKLTATEVVRLTVGPVGVAG
jgi:adenylate cyclase